MKVVGVKSENAGKSELLIISFWVTSLNKQLKEYFNAF